MIIKNSFTVTKSIDYNQEGDIIEKFYIDNKGDSLIGNLTRDELLQLNELIAKATKISELKNE